MYIRYIYFLVLTVIALIFLFFRNLCPYFVPRIKINYYLCKQPKT